MIYELILSYYQAFNAKRYEDMLALLSDDVIHDSNQGRRSYGKAAFRAFLDEMDLHYDEQLSDIVVMASHDERHAAAEFTCRGTYKETAAGLPPARGQSYTLPVGCFFEIQNGKIARVTNYYNLQDWLRQVQ